MKYFKNKLGIFLLLPAFVILFIQAPAQDNKTVQPRMNLEYFKRPGERLLKATLKAREGKQYVFLSDLPVEFNMLADTGSILLGTGYTDDNGMTSFLVSDDQFDHGIYDESVSFESTFSGSEKYKPSRAELNIQDLELNLSFIQEEDEKQIVLTAFGITGNELIPISEDLEIIFYVPRTFTLFRIGSKMLEDGKAIIPFPIDLPGDTLGYMEVIAKIEENDMYGNVEVASSINWGLPQAKIIVEHRGLGDTNAPLWMVYTLIVLLSLVWFHYFYVIRSVYLIKKESKKAIAEKRRDQ